MRLLIVEDEKQICDAVAKSLYDAGYEVDTCYDGEEALEYILTENYDLIVLDLNLPGMDGMEILKELRQSNEETKVLILSARGQIADKVEGLDAGANDYMEKPFHLQELEARIRSLTRRKFVQKEVKDYLTSVLVPTKEEKLFWKAFSEGNYYPDWVFGDRDEFRNVAKHPMALWKCRDKEDKKPLNKAHEKRA